MPLFDGRIATLISPIASTDLEDGLKFRSFRGEDAVSSCYRYDITALSMNPNITAVDLLGQDAWVLLEAAPDSVLFERYFHGMIDEFRFEGNDHDEYFRYRLTLRPAFWMLSKTTDNRIFQNLSSQDIVTKILDEYGLMDYEWKLRENPPPYEYCVQYGESDLDFIQRLLEHDGIFYYFTFTQGKHTLIFCDNTQDLESAELDPQIRFEPNETGALSGEGVIVRFDRADAVVTGAHTLQDYDFRSPSADLKTRRQIPRDHAHDHHERYDYASKHRSIREGQRLAGIRLQEDQATATTISVESTAAMPASGNFFELTEFPRDAENVEYMILRAWYEFADGEYASGSRAEQSGFLAGYNLVPRSVPYRPARVTPRPVMKGVQTAIVVGPAGEEIYTDEYARVKVQFYWDREGRKDENSTCFIRVSAAWAGARFGFIQIPRIGQEVIVDFIEGDPDRPIITGRVYNGEQMPPYELPENMTQSGWKSKSSKSSDGFNELRFEDRAGSEEVYFQAEKDHREWIKNDETRAIDHDFSEVVGNDAFQQVMNNRDEIVDNNKTTQVGVNRDVKIGNNDSEEVGVDRSLTVGKNETIAIGANSTETIGVNHTQNVGAQQTITVGGSRLDTVRVAEARTVGTAQTNSIGASRTVAVGVDQSHTIGWSDSWSVGNDQSINIGNAQTLEVGKDRIVKVAGESAAEIGKNSAMNIGESLVIEVGKNVIITAEDSITFTCGKAAISMKKDGTVNIEGKDITLKGSGKINAKASGDITMKGSKINQN